MQNVGGLHILGQLVTSHQLTDQPADFYKDQISKIIKNFRLTELGSYYHNFPEGGFTGVVALCESHISIHTWPEINSVTLDVYTCNFSRNNADSTRHVFDNIAALFKPKNITEQEIFRSLPGSLSK